MAMTLLVLEIRTNRNDTKQDELFPVLRGLETGLGLHGTIVGGHYWETAEVTDGTTGRANLTPKAMDERVEQCRQVGRRD